MWPYQRSSGGWSSVHMFSTQGLAGARISEASVINREKQWTCHSTCLPSCCQILPPNPHFGLSCLRSCTNQSPQHNIWWDTWGSRTKLHVPSLCQMTAQAFIKKKKIKPNKREFPVSAASESQESPVQRRKLKTIQQFLSWNSHMKSIRRQTLPGFGKGKTNYAETFLPIPGWQKHSLIWPQGNTQDYLPSRDPAMSDKTASHATAKFNLTKYMMELKTLQASNNNFYSDTSSNITTCSDKHKASWNKHGELTFILS